MVDDFVVRGDDAVGEPIVAHELSDVLDRIELGAVGRQRDDADVGGHLELAGHVPTGPIHQHDSMRAGCHRKRDLGQVQRHRFGIAEGQNRSGIHVLLGTNGPEDIG